MDGQRVAEALDRFFNVLMPVNGNSAMVLFPILQAILFIVGIVQLFRPVDRKQGLITIGNSLLYILGVFLIENGYMTVVPLILFAAAAIYLGIRNLLEKQVYEKKELIIASIVYGLLLVVLVTVQILVSKQSMADYFGGITLLQWGYVVLCICLGVRHLNLGIWAFLLMGGGFLAFSLPSDNDPTAWATGEEESVDTSD